MWFTFGEEDGSWTPIVNRVSSVVVVVGEEIERPRFEETDLINRARIDGKGPADGFEY